MTNKAVTLDFVYHQLDATVLERVGRSCTRPEDVRALADAQRSLYKLQFIRLVEQEIENGRSSWTPLRDHLLWVEKQNLAAVTRVVSDSGVVAWIRQSLRAGGNFGDDDARFFGNVVAAACTLAGLPFRIRVAATEGLVVLPVLGAFEIGANDTDIRIVSNGETLALHPDSAGATWIDLPSILLQHEDLSCHTRVDDLNPYLQKYHSRAASPLPDEEVRQWQNRFQDGWRHLVEHHRNFAGPIAEELASLVPLRSEDLATGLGATVDDVLGAIFTTLPVDAVQAALTLAHEFHHSIYGMTIALVDLVKEDTDDQLFYAPWRNDPRSARALLNGAYAHLGIVQFWAEECRLTDNPQLRFAQHELARWRQQVDRALKILQESHALTELGCEFVSRMQSTLLPLLEQSVDDEINAIALDSACDHEARWRLDFAIVEPGVVQHVVDSWTAGGSLLFDAPRLSVRAGAQSFARNERTVQRASFLAGTLSLTQVEELETGNAALFNFDYSQAADCFARAIDAARDHPEEWSGYATAFCRLHDLDLDRFYPEILRATHHRLHQMGHRPSIRHLAEWLSGAT